MTFPPFVPLTVLAVLVTAPTASAQQFDGYTFSQQNRAQIAVAMKQIESTGGSGAGGLPFAGTGGTTIVCGGGASTATANNTCIILNDSTGEVVTDQISDGDQSSENVSRPVTLNDGQTISGADDVLSTLTR